MRFSRHEIWKYKTTDIFKTFRDISFFPVLGKSCHRDGPCSFVKHAECGVDGVCSCKEGYMQEDSNDKCIKG